jgi:hypothetical protein
MRFVGEHAGVELAAPGQMQVERLAGAEGGPVVDPAGPAARADNVFGDPGTP